jgi:hypothetical protein
MTSGLSSIRPPPPPLETGRSTPGLWITNGAG